MDSRGLINALFLLDMATVLKLIIWGNFLVGLLVAVYRSTQKTEDYRAALRKYIAAKFMQCCAWILIILVARIPDLVSVNLGTTLLCTGFFMESRVIMDISGIRARWPYRLQMGVFVLLVGYFNAVVLLDRMSANLLSATLFVIMNIFCFPGIACLMSRKRSRLRSLMGILYLLFFIFALFRGIEVLFHVPMLILDPKILTSVIFFVFIIILFLGGTGFLLLVKEDADSKILEMAFLDPLTGILNRRHFTDEALIAFERHARAKEDMALLFLDLDHFKAVNDTYGHGFGDEVLRDIASVIRKSVRTSDLACRWGGEEFILLLSNGSKYHAQSVAHRLQSALRESHFSQHPAFSYTISIGIHTAVPRAVAADTLESFIEKSDQALYRAKERGRNCIVVYE